MRRCYMIIGLSPTGLAGTRKEAGSQRWCTAGRQCRANELYDVVRGYHEEWVINVKLHVD